MRKCIMAALVLASCLPGVVWPLNPSGVGAFSKIIPGAQSEVPAGSATLTDKIYFRIRLTADNGEHLLRVNIYDGNGSQVLDAESSLMVRNGNAGKAILYGFDAMHDAPGTWWYVAALDGKVIVSSSLVVSP